MASLAHLTDHATAWHVLLVQEIAEIEELIIYARKPADPQALWSLHLLQSTLRLKRQQLKDYMVHNNIS
jgi:hypothetical protein